MAKIKNVDLVRIDLNIPLSLKNKIINYSIINGLNLTSSIICLINKGLLIT